MTDERRDATRVPQGEAEWFEWREVHKDYPPYEIWMAAFAAGRASVSETLPPELVDYRSAVLEEAAFIIESRELYSGPLAAKDLDDLKEYFVRKIRGLKNAAPQDSMGESKGDMGVAVPTIRHGAND